MKKTLKSLEAEREVLVAKIEAHANEEKPDIDQSKVVETATFAAESSPLYFGHMPAFLPETIVSRKNTRICKS